MKIKLDRIISIATLVAAVVAIVLVLKRPAPVAPQAPATIIEQVQAPQSGVQPAVQPSTTSAAYSAPQATPAAAPAVSAPQLAAPPAAASPQTNSQSSSDAVSGALAKMFGASGGLGALTPDSNVGAGQPVIKDQQVSMDGDVVHGKFLTTIAGKDVWVTISGHMGDKDGYATFEPTEIKVGDTNIPVALVNPALQRKMAEERDRLKIPSGGSSQ